MTKKLTETELKVLRLMAEGYSKRDIAAKLQRSYNTIDTHFKNIYKKMNVSSAVQAVVQFLNNEAAG